MSLVKGVKLFVTWWLYLSRCGGQWLSENFIWQKACFKIKAAVWSGCAFACITCNASHFWTTCYTNFNLWSSFYNVKSWYNVYQLWPSVMNEQKIAIQNFKINWYPECDLILEWQHSHIKKKSGLWIWICHNLKGIFGDLYC